MKTVLIYCFPLDARETFEPFARRYVESYLKYPPGCEHELLVVFNNGYPTEQDAEIFWPIKNYTTVKIFSDGLDIGCAQAVAEYLQDAADAGDADGQFDFAVFSTSRVYFHREGWLKRLVEAREKYGDGLYGATGSYECPNGEPEKFPNPHMRTVLYGCNPKHMAELASIYPVTDRASAHSFEAGDHNFSRWFKEKGMPVKMVTWAGEWDEPYWRAPHGCFFRQSNQSNILCWDKWTDHYRDASPEEKRRLERITG